MDKERRYKTSYGVCKNVENLGTIILWFGVILFGISILGTLWRSITDISWMILFAGYLLGIILVIIGTLTTAISQGLLAVIDTENNTREIANCMKKFTK